MLFSDKIRQLRLESGKRQKDLAKAIGVDVPAYSRYEHGERRPKRNQVLRLARIFKTDPDELVAMWLADEAYSHIANDKMATRAATLLQEMLSGEEAVDAPANEAQDTAAQHDEKPAVARNMVTKLGRSLMPHYVAGDAATVMATIEDESIDPGDREHHSDDKGGICRRIAANHGAGMARAQTQRVVVAQHG